MEDKYRLFWGPIPITTDYTTFMVHVYITNGGKEKYYITVVDGKDDLKFCEEAVDFCEVKQRIKRIETEVNI